MRASLDMNPRVGKGVTLRRSNRLQSLLLAQTTEQRELAGRKNMRKSLEKQFQGSDGRRHLIRALTLQPLVRDEDLAAVIAQHARLETIPAGASLIEQGALDTDLFLILEGAVSIAVDGRILASRTAG